MYLYSKLLYKMRKKTSWTYSRKMKIWRKKVQTFIDSFFVHNKRLYHIKFLKCSTEYK